ncbi:MAG: NAD(P)H-hydrate epimerase [Bacteroidales bacterium]|nr:NAD(P)H-hydrate epimerase [Bacteroidales bacterium]
MSFPKVEASKIRTLSLEAFREMDYYAVNNYHLPVELMMESAGLQLARLSATVVHPGSKVLVGVGPGNNGGGGLVAARRLEAWGYKVHIQMPIATNHPMIREQLKRTIAYGVEKTIESEYDLVLDCFFGFSQRLPLPEDISELISIMNTMRSAKISLDIPTGICDEQGSVRFKTDKVLTVAAPKTILLNHIDEYRLFIADVGIPQEVYLRNKIDYTSLGFYRDQIIEVV